MIVQFLAYVFLILAILILFNLGTFSISKKLKISLAKEFEEITQNWLTFFKNGIPVPADHKRIEGDFIGEPVLVQLLFQEQSVSLSSGLKEA